jgi:hypothetical protein
VSSVCEAQALAGFLAIYFKVDDLTKLPTPNHSLQSERKDNPMTTTQMKKNRVNSGQRKPQYAKDNNRRIISMPNGLWAYQIDSRLESRQTFDAWRIEIIGTMAECLAKL